MSFIRATIRNLVLAAITLAALAQPALAAWVAGRGSDVSGTVYLAVVNDAESGERIEFNCTPEGQAFLALTWPTGDAPAVGEKLSLRFLVGTSHRFAASARLRPLERGWAAAELIAPDIIAPLAEVMAVSRGALEVEAVTQGGTIAQAVFDLEGAPESLNFYRSYCRM